MRCSGKMLRYSVKRFFKILRCVLKHKFCKSRNSNSGSSGRINLYFNCKNLFIAPKTGIMEDGKPKYSKPLKISLPVAVCCEHIQKDRYRIRMISRRFDDELIKIVFSGEMDASFAMICEFDSDPSQYKYIFYNCAAESDLKCYVDDDGEKEEIVLMVLPAYDGRMMMKKRFENEEKRDMCSIDW